MPRALPFLLTLLVSLLAGVLPAPASLACANRPTSTTTPTGKVTSMTYWNDNLVKTITEPSNQTTTLAYNGKNLVSSKSDPTGTITRTYDERGRLTGTLRPNGTGNQLTSALLKDTATGTTVNNYAYTYDRAGNRTTETRDDVVSRETPNALNALVRREGVMPIRGQLDKPAQVTINGAAAKVAADNSFEGEISVQPGSNAVTVEATDANGDTTTQHYQVTSTTGGAATLTYDTSGNLLDDGSRTFEWDALNRLTAINYTGTAKRSEFSYNGHGQRIRIVEKDGATVLSDHYYLWCPGDAQPSQERDASNNVTKRYYGMGVQIGGSAFYYTCDHLGSVREMCDDSGVIHARYAYDPWGRRSKVGGDMDTDFGFTGHFFHAPSGLNLTLYRAYDPELGRWVSADPIGELGGLNLYEYVKGNPISRSDPSGLITIGAGLQGGGGGGLGVTGSAGFYVGKTGWNPFKGWSSGLLFTGGGGIEIGLGGSGSGFLQVTNADNVNELKGPGFEIGASGGELIVGGIDYVGGLGNGEGGNFPMRETTYGGISVNLGLGGGTPAEVHGNLTGTAGFATAPWPTYTPPPTPVPAPSPCP